MLYTHMYFICTRKSYEIVQLLSFLYRRGSCVRVGTEIKLRHSAIRSSFLRTYYLASFMFIGVLGFQGTTFITGRSRSSIKILFLLFFHLPLTFPFLFLPILVPVCWGSLVIKGWGKFGCSDKKTCQRSSLKSIATYFFLIANVIIMLSLFSFPNKLPPMISIVLGWSLLSYTGRLIGKSGKCSELKFRRLGPAWSFSCVT
jgi:hypothetical protein